MRPEGAADVICCGWRAAGETIDDAIDQTERRFINQGRPCSALDQAESRAPILEATRIR
jgi:hypothetical protein